MEEILGIYQLPGPLKCYEKPKTFLKISLRGFFEEGGDAKRGCQIKDPLPCVNIGYGMVSAASLLTFT